MKRLNGVTIDTMILAKEVGIRFPEHVKKKDVADPEEDFYDAEIYYFKKPEDAMEMSYLTYWNGEKFRGGYIIYENNHTMSGRGVEFKHNGITMYADDTREIKNILKKTKQYIESGELNLEPCWIKYNFILYDMQLHFWGIEHGHYLLMTFMMKSGIETIMNGMDYDEVVNLFNSGEKNRKPSLKYVAILPTMGVDYTGYIVCDGDTISQAWKGLYKSCSKLEKNIHYYLGIDEYHRTCHYNFKKSIDNLNVKPSDIAIPITQ